jgi:2-succinyl-5-enolpyruvyl-6-hydroxy-3-cyclohexene-1-carboxylate synthase
MGDAQPGPVHLNVPWREPLAPLPVEGDVTATDPLALAGRGDAPLHTVRREAGRADEAVLDGLAEAVESTPRGLIVVGRQPDPMLAEPVAALAAAAGYPVLAEPTSQLRRGPHDRSLVVSSYDHISRGRDPELEPELVVRFGDVPTSKPLRQWLESIRGLEQIVVAPPGEWREPTRRAGTIVRASAASAARGLTERLGRLRPGASAIAGAPFAADWLAADTAVREALDARIANLDEVSEPGVWLALGRALRDGDSVLAASSMPVRDAEAFLRTGPEGVRFASNRGANGIDGLVSTAAGLGVGSAARTWAVLGDLALFHDLGGLAVARRQADLRLIVIDNSGGGIFHFLPQAEAMASEEFEALLGTPSGLDPAAAAELFGMSAAAPSDAAALDDALAGEARMIVVRTDRDRNLELHRELAEAAAAAV